MGLEGIRACKELEVFGRRVQRSKVPVDLVGLG